MSRNRLSRNQSITIRIAVLTLIVTAIATIASFYPMLKDWWNGVEKSPEFVFTYEGAFDQSKPEYEVAFPLGWSGDTPSTARIIITATYAGGKIQGPVYVKIQPADTNLPAVQVGEWLDFKSQSGQPVIVPLSFNDIFDYANLSEDSSKPDMTSDNPWSKNNGQFEIYIEYKGEKLDRKDITVWNTPWFHEVYLSDYEFNVGQTVTATITVFNHGAESEFEVNSCLFKVSTPNYSLDFGKLTSSPDGWWPEKGLERVCKEYQTTQITVPRNAQKTILQPVSTEPINEEGVYVLVSYVLKRVPIIQYESNQVAFDAKDIWLVRDGRQYASFVVLRK